MATDITIRATLDDLYRVEGKAELIGGRIVHQMASGDLPSRIAFEIAASLRNHAKATKHGRVSADGIGYSVPEMPSGRESFSPDASFYDGPAPSNAMRFIKGIPIFAAEVRRQFDYETAAQSRLAAKREDYFAAGTDVVWDVDPESENLSEILRRCPTKPTVFGMGQLADAEPAVPGWRVAMDDIFAE